FDVFVEDVNELGNNLVALQRGEKAAIDVYGRLGLLERPGERDAQAGVLGFAGTVDHASHHCNFHFFDAVVAALPYRHLLAQIGLNLLRHLLEESAGGASAAGTGSDLRRKAADSQGLKNLLRYPNFFAAVAVGRASQREVNG